MATLTYPCYYMYKDAKKEWRWTYYASNAKVIAVSSESYVNKSDCQNGINIMKNSSSTQVIEE